MKIVRVAIAQINTIVGDLRGNAEKILFCINEAQQQKADIVVFPELTITGYPPEDLLLKPHFIKENIRYLENIARFTKDIIAVVGVVDLDTNGIYNSAGILNKKILGIYHKINLPNYSVFDERRYFKPGTQGLLVVAKDFSFSVNICEDIWVPDSFSTEKILQSSQFLVNISASPYHVGKIKERRKILTEKATRFNLPIVYCNLIGGQDELVFDGRSSAFDRYANIISEAKAFEEDFLIVDLPVDSKKRPGKNKLVKVVNLSYKIKKKRKALPRRRLKEMDRIEEIYSALMLGLSDYVRKNSFTKVALGLSGGIDSALVACIGVNAIGKANVLALSMPSRYSSKETQEDAEKIARNLGIRFIKVPIDAIFDVYMDTLLSHFTGMASDITEENIQARIRGNILMAFSNKFGYLVLNTGNKSETSVGYCTLYGDMAGGFAVIKDIPKGVVYELAVHVNKKLGREIIPKGVLKRDPSAELRPGQRDQDILPSYDLLDRIIELYIEKDRAFSDIVKEVKDKDIVKRVLRMIDMNEYKRRQSPPGIKITPRSFGKDRRMPITNKYTEAQYEGHNK